MRRRLGEFGRKGREGVKKYKISRRDAETQRFELNNYFVFFSFSAPLRLCARCLCSFRDISQLQSLSAQRGGRAGSSATSAPYVWTNLVREPPRRCAQKLAFPGRRFPARRNLEE